MPTFLITGATGAQGGLVARELLSRGHSVRALVRTPDAPQARELAQLGAELHHGDLRDPASITSAISGTDRLYLVTTPNSGREYELNCARNAIEAAAQQDCYVVFSSIANADTNTAVDYVGWKRDIEQHLQARVRQCCIVAPAYFMENATMPMAAEELRAGRLTRLLEPTVPIMQVAVADLAQVACSVLERPDAFSGERIDLASDCVTGLDMAAALEQELGLPPLEHNVLPPSVLDADPVLGAGIKQMIGWLSARGFDIDLPNLHRRFPEVRWHSFASWVRACAGELLPR